MTYTYGLELIFMTKGGSTHYYIYDGLGNVVAVTDDTGQTVQTYDYDAFGNVISTTGELANPYQFIGAYGCQDDGVGLIYMRARYYMPSIGRFISRDPVWGNAHYPLSLNRYLYTKNNPVNYTDPTGYGITCTPTGPSTTGFEWTLVSTYPHTKWIEATGYTGHVKCYWRKKITTITPEHCVLTICGRVIREWGREKVRRAWGERRTTYGSATPAGPYHAIVIECPKPS